MTTERQDPHAPAPRRHGRRAFLGLGVAAVPLAAQPSAPRATDDGKAPLPRTAAQALARLRRGNARYAEAHARHPHESRQRRRSVAVAQHPFAVVLGCIDSRVPPELVFDQGLGDLLVIRTAGHVLDEAVLGSVQYGVAELGVPLVVVLGHERCGAVGAAVARVRDGGHVSGHLAPVVDAIAPAARATRFQGGDWVDNAVRKHVDSVVAQVGDDPALGPAVVTGARFDLDTGRVRFRRP
ncbi:carbonic anhydrase [Streptomyces sp. TRM66268-LWL]|uniref:Carbonic anhydrase n=1 Tax=Streptomyces polyasparticus TaxID=2767826 RepID=A0ABR7SE37_9ACTN|nr:carbonic anhydrase [Streptomyces polyasparticus]MBC9713766.1 carbonic anhydrase [Streptomyces polyasparticus]